jgi:hypothetical protein
MTATTALVTAITAGISRRSVIAINVRRGRNRSFGASEEIGMNAACAVPDAVARLPAVRVDQLRFDPIEMSGRQWQTHWGRASVARSSRVLAATATGPSAGVATFTGEVPH